MAFEKGKSGNPGGLTSEFVNKSNWFKNWAIDIIKSNPKHFRDIALKSGNGQKFMDMVARMCPQVITGADGGALEIKVINMTATPKPVIDNEKNVKNEQPDK